MSSSTLDDLPYANETDIVEVEHCETNGPLTPPATMANNSEEKTPSNLEIMNMLKELKTESVKQSKALDSKLRTIASDISYMKNEMSRHFRSHNVEADQRLANLTFHEMQTLCQLVITTFEVDEEFMTNDDDPDDLFLNVYFHGEEHVLSTFYPCELSLDGKIFKSAEHLYQYKKAEALGQAQAGDTILGTSSGRAAKATAKRIVKVTPEWEKLKEDVMEDVLQVKAMQCREFRERLLSTGSRRLIHDVLDPVWGWGKDGFGQNIMGRALERIRTDLEEKSSSVFMDDDITQMQSAHVPSPIGAAYGDEELIGDQHSDHGRSLEDDQEEIPSRTVEENYNKSPHHKKKYRKNRRSEHHNEENDVDHASGGNKEEFGDGNASGKGKPKSERSVWSGEGGTALQVKIPSKNVDDTPEDDPSNNHHREVSRDYRRGRRGKRGSPNPRHHDYSQEEDATPHNDTERYDNERSENREKTQGRVEDDRYVRTRDHQGGHQYEGSRRQWSGQRSNNNYYGNRNGYQNSRRGRPNRRPSRGRGQSRDRYRRNTSESDSHSTPEQNFSYEGRMYSDYHSEEASSTHKERYASGGSHSGEGGQRRGSNHGNHPQQQQQRHHSAGRGSDYYNQVQRSHQHPGGPARRGPGGRYGPPQRQVDLENDQCQVTVEMDGQGRDKEEGQGTEEGNSNNPIGHPETSSHL